MANSTKSGRLRRFLEIASLAMGGVALAHWALAEADEPNRAVALEWIAPPECPEAAYLERQIARLLASAPQSGKPRLRAHADVVREGASWRVSLVTMGPQGEGRRLVTADTCRAVADATALIVALAVDPRQAANEAIADGGALVDAGARVDAGAVDDLPDGRASASTTLPPLPAADASTSATSPTATSTSTPTSTPTSTSTSIPTALPRPKATPIPSLSARPRESAASSAPGHPPAISVGVSLAVDIGTLPSAASGVEAFIALRPGFAPWLRLQIDSAIWGSQAVTVPATASGSFELRIFDLLACDVVPAGRWELSPCLGAEVAWVSARGIGETVSTQSHDVFWPALLVDAAATYRVFSWLALRAELGVAIAVDQPDFVAVGVPPSGATLVHRPDMFAKRFTLGLEWRF